MNKQFKAVSMDCTQEQFEQLRPHLEKIEGVIIGNHSSFVECPILVNNFEEQLMVVSNVFLSRKNDFNRTYIGEFNPKAFIEACGGEWVEETPSMKGKWFKYVWSDFLTAFTKNKWYKCCKDSPIEIYAFINNDGKTDGFSHDNEKYFDLSNPMDFNPDTAAMAAPQPATQQPETKFKEVPFNWETYLQYKDKGAYLEYNDFKINEAYKFNSNNGDLPMIVLCVGGIISFANKESGYMSDGKFALKLFIPTTKKTIRVWAIVKDSENITASFVQPDVEFWQNQGCQVIELTKEIEL